MTVRKGEVMGNRKQFDYYIFIDYSEDLIGFIVIKGEEISKILPKIVRFRHYKEVKHKTEYLRSIRRLIERSNLYSNLVLIKVIELRKRTELFNEIKNFIGTNYNRSIFLSLDNQQQGSFERFFHQINFSGVKVVLEGDLTRHSPEYNMNLIIDNILNIERNRHNPK